MPKGYSKRNQGGWKHKKESILKMSKNRIGLTANEKNGRWEGDRVSYPALHNWVRKHYKKTLFCEECLMNPGKDKIGHTKLQWANISGDYQRARKDWKCLCCSCHRKIDKPWKKKIQNSGNYSKVVGITFDKARNKWKASLMINYKKVFSKRFITEEEAIIELNKIKKQYE